MRGRSAIGVASVVADVGCAAIAHTVAVWLRSGAHALFPIRQMPFSVDWSAGVLAVAVVVAFYGYGLYEREAFVSRSLHIWTIGRASVLAFVMSAITVYLLKSDRVDQSRFILLLSFALFVPMASVLRVYVVDRVFRRWAWSSPGTLLVGDSAEARHLAERLAMLRGFDRVDVVRPPQLRPDMDGSLGALLDARVAVHDRVDSVFVDTLTVTPREVFDITYASKARGAEVYVLSGLLGPLEGSGLLTALFRAPVIRVRRGADDVTSHAAKRVVDVVGATLLLAVASPLVVVLALMIKATSQGPAFYTQVRVGRFGIPFRFYKFRSMTVDGDVSGHREYAQAFIAGEAEPEDVETEDVVIYKRLHDSRITRVGRFIRKYSLDEIPQFWNVLKNEMSLVGPRPPLPYEVERYDDWAMRRLTVPPGVTGMWQVEGRSRVTFEEMILQDLMYAANMRLLVDIGLCVRTVPAALLGYGGG